MTGGIFILLGTIPLTFLISSPGAGRFFLFMAFLLIGFLVK
jgi:hypothetical protein